MALDDVLDAEPAMDARGVSRVARSRGQFVEQFEWAGGDPQALPSAWQTKRDGFVARHMAQVRQNREPTWQADGEPTRRHLALIAWAYTPTPARTRRWLETQR